MNLFNWLRNLLTGSNSLPVHFARQDISNEELLQVSRLRNDWQSILPLTSLLRSDDPTVVRCADAAIAAKVRRLRPLEYLYLDQAMRETLEFRYMVRIDQIDMLVDVASNATFGVMSFAGNGYVREAAVAQLADIRDGSEIPFLLIRLTDWVLPIAQRASAAIEKRLTPENAHLFVPFLALIPLLSSRRRAKTLNVSQISFEQINKLMTSQQAVPALLEGLATNPESVTRRACFEYLLDVNGIDVLDVIQTAVQDSDPLLRRLAFNSGHARLSTDEAIPLLKQACHDQYPRIRVDSLRPLAELAPNEAIELVHNLLLDRSASVRSVARYYTNKLTPEINLLDHYKNCLTEQKALPITIAAIGEIGSSKDASLIAPFLNSPDPRCRKAAIKSIANLDGSAYSEDFLNALSSLEPGVSRAATIALTRYVHVIDSDKIWKTFEDSNDVQIQFNCLRLLNRTEKWSRITHLLQALHVESPQIQERSHSYIARWIATYRTTWRYTMPASEQAARFTAALQKSAQQLSPVVRDLLATCAAEMSKI